MSHVRTQIRDRFVALLTPVGSVYASRIWPIAEGSLPVILVYTNSEEIELDSLDDLLRRLTVVVEVVAQATPDLDTALDDILEQVEDALAADSTLNGLAMESLPAAIEVTMSGAGSQPTGRAKLSYSVLYRGGAVAGGGGGGGSPGTGDFAPAGFDTEIQFNDGGVMGADPSLTFDKASRVIKVAGSDSIDPGSYASIESGTSDGAGVSAVGSIGWNFIAAYNSLTAGRPYHHSGYMQFYRARGTIAAPVDVEVGDDLGVWFFDGLHGGESKQGGCIWAEVESLGPHIAATVFIGTKPTSNTNPLRRWGITGDGGLVGYTSDTTPVTGGSKGAATVNAAAVYVQGSAVLTDAPSDGQKYVRKDGAWVIA